MRRTSYGAMSVWSGNTDGVLVLRFRGVVTLGALREFVRSGAARDCQAYAVLNYVDDCIIPVSSAGFTGLLTLPGAPQRLRLPVAIVCAQEKVQTFREHAVEAARIGYLREVFTEPSDAIAWCQDRVAAARLAELAALVASSPFRLRA